MRERRLADKLASIYAANTLLFTVATAPVAAAADKAGTAVPPRKPIRAKAQAAREEVSARADGLKVTITVTGKPGRHVALLHAAPGAREYKVFPGTRRVIGPSGVVRITADMAAFLGKNVTVKVATARSASFSTDVRETEGISAAFTKVVSAPSAKGTAQPAGKISIGKSATSSIFGGQPTGTGSVKGGGASGGGSIKSATRPVSIESAKGVRSPASPGKQVIPKETLFPKGIQAPKNIR
jgi:hypothetical protein